MNLMRCKPISANLKEIQGSPHAGSISINKVINKYFQCQIIHQSVTGLFEQEIDLLSL